MILEEKRKHLKAKKNQIATSLRKLCLEKFFRALWRFFIEWELHENDNGNVFQRRGAAAATLWNIKRSARQVPGLAGPAANQLFVERGNWRRLRGLLSSGFVWFWGPVGLPSTVALLFHPSNGRPGSGHCLQKTLPRMGNWKHSLQHHMYAPRKRFLDLKPSPKCVFWLRIMFQAQSSNIFMQTKQQRGLLPLWGIN